MFCSDGPRLSDVDGGPDQYTYDTLTKATWLVRNGAYTAAGVLVGLLAALPFVLLKLGAFQVAQPASGKKKK